MDAGELAGVKARRQFRTQKTPMHPKLRHYHSATPYDDVMQHVYVFQVSSRLFLNKIYTTSPQIDPIIVTMKFLTITIVLAVAINLASASPFPDLEKYANALMVVQRKSPILPPRSHPLPRIYKLTITQLAVTTRKRAPSRNTSASNNA